MMMLLLLVVVVVVVVMLVVVVVVVVEEELLHHLQILYNATILRLSIVVEASEYRILLRTCRQLLVQNQVFYGILIIRYFTGMQELLNQISVVCM